MAKLKKGLEEIERFTTQAFKKGRDLIKAGKKTEALDLLTDIEEVLSEYESVFKSVVPEEPFRKPFPRKNIFEQLGWVAVNLAYIAGLSATFSGDIFAPARAKAAEVARKWGIEYKEN